MMLIWLILSTTIFATPIKLLKPESLTPSKEVTLQMELDELKRQNDRLDLLLKKAKNSKEVGYKKKGVKIPILPTIYETKEKILIGTTLKGLLLNSIHSTNLESPILVRIFDERLKDAKILCQGVTTHKRVQTVCTKLILPDKEVDINVQLLNTDGSAGIVGEYEDKKEEMMEGVILDSTSQGFLSALSDRTATPFGDSLSRSLKNQLIQGSISGLEASKDISLRESLTLEPIVKIGAGTPVLIFFKETLNDF